MAYRLKKELDAARYAHTLGVEKTAREMAEKFGVDEEKAALAGLLHDCAKCMPLSQMTKAAKNEKLDPVMKESKALMHAVAGTHVAQDVYDVHDPEVLGAIRWHTTGHANMTKLEKIVYLADMIEPNRKPYPGLEALRKLCMTDLDEAMHMALLMSLDHVREQGKPLHPDTMAALAEYEPGLVGQGKAKRQLAKTRICSYFEGGKTNMDQKAIALAAAKALDAKRGKDIVVLKVDEMTVITDYMVIATGRSVPQVKALAENVEEELAKLDLFARRREGVNEGHWCILDYGDVMVHIFHEQDREYYQLERLWSNGANEVEVALDGAGAAAEA